MTDLAPIVFPLAFPEKLSIIQRFDLALSGALHHLSLSERQAWLALQVG